MIEKSPSQDQLKELFNLAFKFEQIKCWEYMEDTDIFGVMNPENGEIGYICILGNAGEVFGINIYRGARGLDGYLKVLSGEVYEGNNLFSLQYCLSLTFEVGDYLEKKDIAAIYESGISWVNKNMLPIFRSYIPGYYPWYLTEEEAKFFIICLQQTIDVCKRFKSNRGLFSTKKQNSYFIRISASKGEKIIWEDSFLKAVPYIEEAKPIVINELKVQKITKKLFNREGIWQIGCAFFPLCINDKKSRPYMPLNFLCVNGITGEIIGSNMSDLRSYNLFIGEEILNLIEKCKKVPETIIVNNKDFVTGLQPLMKKLGITIKYKKIMGFYEEAENALIDHINNRSS